MADTGHLAQLLAGVPLLGGLDDSDRVRLVARSAVRSFAKGQVLFVHGDPAEWMAVVVTGRLKVSVYSPAGAELLLVTVEPGEAVGELGVLSSGTRSATAEALSAGSALHVPRTALDDLLAERPQVARAMIETLADLVRQTTGTAADLVFLDLPRRVAKFLLDQAAVSLTQSQLAARLGASRQRVNGVLGDFERRGWITGARSQVHIVDRPALLRLLDG